MEAGFAVVAQPACGACELAHTYAGGFGAIPANSENDRLTGLLCPKNVAARSDADALLQGSVETIGEFGKAEMLDHPAGCADGALMIEHRAETDAR